MLRIVESTFLEFHKLCKSEILTSNFLPPTPPNSLLTSYKFNLSNKSEITLPKSEINPSRFL